MISRAPTTIGVDPRQHERIATQFLEVSSARFGRRLASADANQGSNGSGIESQKSFMAWGAVPGGFASTM
jgi:hypothetical protein